MTGFWTQANALFRKNLTFQKKNIKTNLRLLFFPIVLCLLLMILQSIVNNQLDTPSNKCGCKCIGEKEVHGQCHNKQVCGIEYSDNPAQAALCPISSPLEWPPLMQMPDQNFIESKECARHGTCPVAVLVTGRNRTFGEGVAGNMFPNASDFSSFSGLVLASASWTAESNFLEPAFTSDLPIYYVQSQCGSNSTSSIALPVASVVREQEVRCVQGQNLWRNNESDIKDELYVGHKKGYTKKKTNDILAGYDFLNSGINNYHVTVWTSSHDDDTGSGPHKIIRVPRLINLVSNAFLQLVGGRSTHMLFDFVKEMPKPETVFRLDFSSLLGPIFFTWVILQLYPIVLTALVYEKQQNLRIMMKMHGLGDGPYLMISYAYFLAISVAYMFCFVVFGSAVGLNFFTLNDYSIQFVFYFIYVNLQIAMAFLVAALFSNVKTAAVVGYITVFATGLLGEFFFKSFLQHKSFSRVWIIVMELYPGFSLYSGLYEFSQYAIYGTYSGAVGMQWGDLSDSNNNMARVLKIMVVEWFVVIFITYYIDQVAPSGTGVRKSPLFFLEKFKKKSTLSSLRKPGLQRQGSNLHLQLEKPDVVQERERVEQSLVEQDASHSVLCDNLKKVYAGRDGNPEKFAVRGLSLAFSHGECFGMLGPNGAGKTSFINMMIGLTKPSSGTAYIQGLDIRSDMDQIYSNMGVCPQHDLLWETLTGREHLLFYGRLKNLKGSALTQAVEESLKSVNLFNGGVADKKAGKYSGGMKRRLSVAISLIGDPKVVYMDEPSTGLDPASRNNLWNVVKRAKENRAIILTTHSMEEAEHLCDRLGIFVDGSLQCIGNPKELKGRYGGSYVFTMTTSSNHEADVENLVKGLSPNANKIYQISGTQKFEIPKQDIKIADVFRAVENAKSRFAVQAWGLADTTLEDVFIKVAREAQPIDVLS